jgi:DNA-binding NarL/FixJ family response regulator
MRSSAIIEDDDQVRDGLNLLVRAGFPDTEIRSFKNAEEALHILISEPVELALVDINLPGMNGIDFISRLKMIHPGTLFMVLTVYDDSDTIFNALKAGAVSYLLKSTPAERVTDAIREVLQGGSPISSQIARKVIASFVQPVNEHRYQLTRRELEILELLAKGYRYKEIAEKVFISLETVRSHVRNTYEKLQVNNRVEALRKTGLL